MRFRLIINPLASKHQIAINYQHLFSAWIYKTISVANAEFADQLHQKGYSDGLRKHKLFTFSRLMVHKPKPMPNNRLAFASTPFPVELSFYLDDIFRPFIMGLFNGSTGQLVDKFGGIDFEVKEVQRMADPDWKTTLGFETLSPVHVSVAQVGTHPKYLSPYDQGYEGHLFENLTHKYQAAHPNTACHFERNDFRFELASDARKRRIIIKEHLPEATSLIAYDYKCRITAPHELMQMAYHTGLGKSNAMGFGMLRGLDV